MLNNSFHQQIVDLIKQWKIPQLCDLYVSGQFLWHVKGSGQLSATYTRKEEYFSKALDRLSKHIQQGATISVLETYSLGSTLILELEGKMTTLSGKPYCNEYCWIIKTHHSKITSITAYLDTLLLEQIITNEESS